MHATSLRLPDDIGQRLHALSQRTGRTKTFYIIEAVKEHLDKIEDIYIAEQRLADLRARRSRTFTTEEVRAELGLEN